MDEPTSNLPYSHFANINESDPAFERWSQRLVPCGWTRLFSGINEKGDRHKTFLDGLNGLPVTRMFFEKPEYRTAVPHEYTSHEPFQAILFGGQYNIWLLDSDGEPQLAPSRNGGNTWGYHGGTGCRHFANLLADLLDGAWSSGPDGVRTPDEGLYRIAVHKWPSGTVLTRDEIAARRTGTFGYPSE